MKSPIKLMGVEASRGTAALLVVLVHAGNMLAGSKYLGEIPLSGLFKFAHAGVDFFFVLSGFIIYHVHADDVGQSSAWLPYIKKRLVRIYPVYWVVLTIYAAVLFVSPTREQFEQIPSVALASIFLLPHPFGPVLGPAWSLSHELLFYGLFGLLFLHRIAGLVILGAWAFLTTAHQIWGVFGTQFWFDQFLFRIFNLHFFFGIGVAWCHRKHVNIAPRVFFFLGLMIFFGMGIFESWGPKLPTEWAPGHIAYALGSALALYGIVTLEAKGRMKVPSIMVALGSASYSVYLVHVIIIMFWQQALLHMRWLLDGFPNLTFFITVILAVTAGMMFHRVVEIPVMRFFRRDVVKDLL